MMDRAERARLIDAACRARSRAYARYSRFQVGAAVLTATGEVVPGANVENASYGLTMCAERVAIASAVAAGHDRFVALAVAAAGAVPPCGACLQVVAEFCADLPILLVDAGQPDKVTEVRLSELIPRRFSGRDLGGES